MNLLTRLVFKTQNKNFQKNRRSKVICFLKTQNSDSNFFSNADLKNDVSQKSNVFESKKSVIQLGKKQQSYFQKGHDKNLINQPNSLNSSPEENKMSFLESDKNSKKRPKNYYTSYSKLSEVKLVTIGIASPLRILQWAEKTLPNGKVYGEVLNANTLHHKTFKPQFGGLFCERIFGPLKDFECACENSKMNKLVKQDMTKNLQNGAPGPDFGSQNRKQIRKYCQKCDVEYTWSVIRRYQLGYIKLSSPVTHVWFLKGTPSYLSLLLDMKKRHLQLVTYCSETLTLENSLSKSQKSLFLDSPSEIFASWQAIWKPKNEVKKLPIKQNYALKRSTVKPIHNKEWKNLKMSLKTIQNVDSQIEISRLLRNSFFELTQKKKNLGRQSQKSPTVNLYGLPLLLSSLQLSVYYNCLKENKFNKSLSSEFVTNVNSNGHFQTASLMNSLDNRFNLSFDSNFNTQKPLLIARINQILKKLPIDFYILCSLERMLHKKLIVYSIIQTWQKLYKKAYIKAIYKVTKVYSNLVTKEMISFSGSMSRENEMNLPYWDEKNQRNLEIFTHEQSLRNFSYFKHLLKQVKNGFKNHVLMTLEKLKQPVLLINYTTKIDYSLLEILKLSSQEMQSFLEADTKLLINLFANALTKQLFIQKLLTTSNKGLSLNISLLNHIFYGNSEKNSKALSELNSVLIKSYLKNSVLFYKKKVNELKKDLLILKNSSVKTQTNNEVSTKGYGSKTVLKSFYKQIIPNNITEKKAKKKKLIKNSAPDLEVTTNQSFKRKKVLYNTVYTLSHRERWESEKDWQIFLLYNSVSPKSAGTTGFSMELNRTNVEWNDSPIFAYRDHIFPVYSSNSLSQSNRSFGLNSGNFSAQIETELLSNAFFSGPGIIQQLLNELTFPELKKLDKQNRLLLYQLNQNILKVKKQVKIFVYDKSAQLELKDLCKKRDLLIRRTKLVRKLFKKDSDPSSMILTVLPVLPPDLRPIVKMGSQIAASDLNRLYQQVIYRNERLKFFLKDPATSQSYEMKYAQRLLQEAVDNLIQNSKSSANSEKDSRGRALKSLSDVLKGKQGRFRQFLLGKRVDYSGRSVIVVGPKLKLHECGLPLEMALELYLPFLLKRILNKNYAKTVIGAKALIQNNSALAYELLREIMQVSPVLLNRAPTLHRLGVQAFVPKLVEGRAILLHPLVCSAFNADFDGDQMAVHVPITVEARAEAWKLMLSRNNILSPATGDPLAIPSQDMVLGCYYLTTYPKTVQQKALISRLLNNLPDQERLNLKGTLTTNKNENLLKEDFISSNVNQFTTSQTFYFKHLQDVINAYNQQKLKVHTLVWVQWMGLIENGNDQEEPIEIRLTASGQWQEISSNYHRFYDKDNLLINQYMVTTPGRILFNLLLQAS